MIFRGVAQMSVDAQRAAGVIRQGAEARADRQRGVMLARNFVKSCHSYRLPDHTSNAEVTGR